MHDSTQDEREIRAAAQNVYRDFLSDIPEEEWPELLQRVLVSLVRSGKWGPEEFDTPEAYRTFCEKNGIEL